MLDGTLGPEMIIIAAAVADIMTIIDTEMRGHPPDMEAVVILAMHHRDA